VPEKNFWTLWWKGRLTEADTDHPAGRHSIRTNQCPPSPSPHIFYGPDALPAAQSTVSKHWRHTKYGTKRLIATRQYSGWLSGGYFHHKNINTFRVLSVSLLYWNQIMTHLFQGSNLITVHTHRTMTPIPHMHHRHFNHTKITFERHLTRAVLGNGTHQRVTRTNFYSY